MKTAIRNTLGGLAFLSALVLILQPITLRAQGAVFTYQGRLESGGSPANGIFDLQFAIFDSDTGGALVAGPLTNSAAPISNGLFTVALDFGAGVFTGPARWLEIAVRTNGAAAFQTLSPRQPVTPTPYAITASHLVSGGLAPGTYANAVTFNNPANQFTGDGTALSNVNAAALGGLYPSNFWQTGGNSGSGGNWYVGTADNQPFELRANKARALRVLPTWNGWPNIVAGASNNLLSVDATAATISGGAWNDIRSTSGSSTISGGQHNVIGTNAAGSFIGGGQWNTLADGAVRTVIAGGYGNVIDGTTGTNAPGLARDVTDGTSNTLLFGERNPGGGVIGGGTGNRIGRDADNAVIGGGERNVIQGDGAVPTLGSLIGGGVTNQIGSNAPCAVIDGGRRNVIGADAGASTIGGGGWNTIQPDAVFGTIGGGYSNVLEGVPFADAEAVNGNIADGNSNTIFIGETNVAGGVIAGGYRNRIGYDSSAACIGGGWGNTVESNAPHAAIGGGRNNRIADGRSNTILAGENNEIAGADYAAIPGGARNYVSGNYGLAAGRRARAIHDGCFVWADGQDADFNSSRPNEFAVRADGAVRFITSGAGMTLDGQPVLAGSDGGALTNLNADAITTGTVPTARLSASVALRDTANVFTATQAISGWLGIGTTSPQAPLHVNTPVGEPSSLKLTSGGSWPLSLVQTPSSIMVISNGGAGRIFMPSSGNVGIGGASPLHKLHVGNYGTVSTIVDSPVKAVVENTHENGRATLVAVAGPGTVSDTTNRVEVILEADEGQRIGLLATLSAHPLQIRVDNTTRVFVDTNGNVGIGTTSPTNRLHVNGGITCTTLVQTSDRDAKEDFQPVSPGEVLEKVAALPITRWRFKGQTDGPHLGPMAQDFHAAFGLGNGDTTITALDADGVALAAIQGLNQKLAEELKRRDAENAELKQRLLHLEEIVRTLAAEGKAGAR